MTITSTNASTSTGTEGAPVAGTYVHPLAAALVTDPTTPPDLVFFVGSLGPGGAGPDTRLFLDPAMSRYVDIPTADAVRTERAVPGPGTPWPQDVVWVPRDVGARLRTIPVSLAAGAPRQVRRRAARPATPAGYVLTVNLGRAGSGPSTPEGDDDGIGGGENNYHVQWPGNG